MAFDSSISRFADEVEQVSFDSAYFEATDNVEDTMSHIRESA